MVERQRQLQWLTRNERLNNNYKRTNLLEDETFIGGVFFMLIILIDNIQFSNILFGKYEIKL